jgi:uncharacterized protein involved in outer membrane biogenesis
MATRRPSLVRIGLWSLASLVALVIVGGAVIALTFDPDSLKPRIIAAVKRETGRDLTLQGRIRLGLSLQPTLTVQGVSFANPPGFSRPQMATLERLDLRLALLPLLSHSVEIDRLVLVKPDIILETDAQGRPNWQFTPEPGATTPKSDSAGSRQGTATRINVADTQIEDGTITWRDGRTERSAVIAVTSLRASAASPDADLNLSMAANYDGTPFTVAGKVGPMTRLQERGAGAAWPVQAQLEAAGARLAVDGTMSQPMEGRGYRMKLNATVPDLAALAPLLPGARLPPLHDVSLSVQIADTGAALPELSDLTLHVGQSDLATIEPGLRLDKLDAAAARLDQPVQVSASGSFDNSPATVTGSIGVPAGMLTGSAAAGPIPLDLDVHALGSSLTIKGTAARGADGRPSMQADVVSDKIDLDSLLAALRENPAPAPTPASAGTAPAAAPAKPPSAGGRLIPDTPLPFDLLRLADADVKLSVAQLVAGGVTYRAITTHLDLRSGRLRLDPVSADLPAGHLNAVFSADAAQPAPEVALKLQSAAFALQPLLAAMNQPAFITGNMHVQADLHGVGATPHAIAASLDGSLGLAMTNGTVDNRILGNALGTILRAANLLDLVGRGGTSQVHCFVARLDAYHGIATLRSLVFASTLLTMDGDGSLNLGAETLDLHLRPQARLAGADIVVPLRVSGSFRAPSAASDPAAAVAANAGTAAGAILGGATPLGVIAGALGAKELFGENATECATPQAAKPLQQLQPKLPNIGGVLKQLFR